MEVLELVKQTVKVLSEKKAVDIRVIRIDKLSVVADYFIICNGTSSTQIKALADEVEYRLSERGATPLHREGYRFGNWVLLDYGSVVIHIFHKETRDFYKLERLWADGEELDPSSFLGSE